MRAGLALIAALFAAQAFADVPTSTTSTLAYGRPEPFVLPPGDADELSGPIAVAEWHGLVNPAMGSYVESALARAEQGGAQLLLIELDTPGGLVSTTESIVKQLLGARIATVVYVSPSGAHAASAGTLITLAAHIAVMAPATRIGAAHPVSGSGKDIASEGGGEMARKVENDLATLAEGIAAERHRNRKWAEDAVRRSVSITETRALELGVIDLVARDRAELLQQLEGRELLVGTRKVRLAPRGAPIVTLQPSIREQLVNFLASPGIAMLLGLIGVLGLLIELYHPGLIVPGVVGALAIVCTLVAAEQLPIDVGGALLIAAGLALIVAELYTSTYGVLGILGAIGLAVGLLLVFDPSSPDFAVDPSIRLTISDVLPAVFVLTAFVGYVSFAVLGTRRRRSVTGTEGLIGSRGFVLKPVGPDGGMVFVHGEYWKARSASPLAEKAEIEVVAVDGLVLEVARVLGPS